MALTAYTVDAHQHCCVFTFDAFRFADPDRCLRLAPIRLAIRLID